MTGVRNATNAYKALECIKLLRRRVLYFKIHCSVPAIDKWSWDLLFVNYHNNYFSLLKWKPLHENNTKPNRPVPNIVNLRVLVLYWNPGCCALGPFGGWLLVLDKLMLLYPTSLAGPVTIEASSPVVESTLGGFPAPLACVRWQGGDTEYPLAGPPISLVHGGYSL